MAKDLFGFEVSNERKPVVVAAAKGKDPVFGFVASVQHQISIINEVIKDGNIPLTDKGRKERTWWWEDKKTGKFSARIVLGVASPVDLRFNKDVLDHDKVKSKLDLLVAEFHEGNSTGVEPSLFEAYDSMVSPTIVGLKDLAAVRDAFQKIADVAGKELRPYIEAAKRYAPVRGSK